MLYTVKETAALLRVSEFTILELIKAGELKALRLTKRTIRIESTDLDAFRRKSMTVPTPE